VPSNSSDGYLRQNAHLQQLHVLATTNAAKPPRKGQVNMAKKVLVVDDSSTVRQQVGLVLTQAGFQVVEAVDGVDGVNKIGSTPDLSLVICDVNMPQMNGIELVEKVMQDGKNAGLPILMLTTEGQASMIERAKKAGAKGWMVKPFKPDLLLAAANKISRSA